MTGSLEIEYSLIPEGLHVVGEPLSNGQREQLLGLLAEAHAGSGRQQVTDRCRSPGASSAEAIIACRRSWASQSMARVHLHALHDLARINQFALRRSMSYPPSLRALNGQYTRPAPGGDVLRNPAVLPTGRNIHGFDPFRIPSAFAVADGARQAARLLRGAFRGRPCNARIDRHGAVGYRQPQDRRRPDRAGAGACLVHDRALIATVDWRVPCSSRLMNWHDHASTCW